MGISDAIQQSDGNVRVESADRDHEPQKSCLEDKDGREKERLSPGHRHAESSDGDK